MEFGFTQGANEDDDSTASNYQEFLLNATQFEDESEGEEEVERSPQQSIEVVNILEDEETNDGRHLEANNQNKEGKAIEADPSSFRTGISSVTNDEIMEMEEEEDELDLQISQTLREITEMDEQALRISQLTEHKINSQTLKRDVTTERSEVFIDLSEQEEIKTDQPLNSEEEKQQKQEVFEDTKLERVEIIEIDIDETQLNEIDLHISQTPCDYVEENLANHLSPSIHSPIEDVEKQNLDDSAVPDALTSVDKTNSQEKNYEPSEYEQNMEEDEINLHISQTPGDYGASQIIAVNSERENLQVLENLPTEKTSQLQDLEQDKEVTVDAPENLDNKDEETDDELNLHITQSQFPEEQISENEKLKELNATYVSPVKVDHLQPKKIESVNDSETQFDENLRLNVEAAEEDDETDINLCITPSQPQNFLPTDLDLTPIIPSTSDQKKDKEEEDLNQTSKSMIMIDPFQFMIQPSNNNDNKEETGTNNHYSIYDFLQGTPNQLSGLSIIKNRGDISMYSTANVNSGGGVIDNDATQLDHLPSSQTFLSKANSIVSSQFIDKSDEKFQPVNISDDKEEKKELILPNSRDETKNKAEVVENDSPDWLEANDRIPSTKIRSKDNSSGTTKNSSSSSDITSSDVDTLKELYEKKLKELEELKKAMETAAQSLVKVDEPPKKKESQDDGFQASQLPTEEYAKILTSLANTTAPPVATAQTDNLEKAEQSKEVIAAKKVHEASSNRSGGSAFGGGWDDDSGPLIAAPQRKFNTFAKISSPVSATKTGNDGIELNSAEKVSKFRRKFAGGTPTAPNGPSSLSREVDSSPEKRRIHFDFDLTDTAPPDFEDEKEVKKKIEKGKEKEKEKEKAETIQEKITDSNSKRDTKEDPKVAEKKKETKDSVASVESATKQSDKKKSESASKVVSAVPSSSSEKGVRDYIPVSFKEGKVPQKFAEVWPVLESIGWRWTKGKGLIDFYYIRPDAKAAPPFVLNQDYFSTTDDLLAYVHSKCPASATKEKNERSGESTTRLRKIKKNLVISDDEEEEEFSVTLNNKGQSLTSKKQPSKASSDKKSNKEESDYQEESESDEEGENEDADEDEDEDENDEEEEEEEKYDLRTIPWKDLWKILRSYGWSWDFGPNVLNYFYVPKFSFKRDKEAVLGVHKFTNEDEIRRYLKREYRHRMQQQKEIGNVKKSNQNTDDEAEGDKESMWSLFYLSSNGSNNSQNASTQESQYLLDNLAEDWTLAKNRKKRNREDPNTSTSTTSNNQKKKDIKSSKNSIQQQQQSKKQKIDENTKRDDKQQGRKSSSGPKIPSTPESNYGEEVNTQIPTLSPERFQPSSSAKKLKPVTATTTPHHQNNTEGDRNSFIKQSHEKSLKFDSTTVISSDKVKVVKNDRKSVSPVPEQASLSSTTPTNKLSSSLFASMKFLFSGIQEDVRERLEHLVKKNGGVVLSDIPKDINYYEENFLAFQQPSLRTTSNSPYFHRERVYNSNDDDDEDDEEEEDQKDNKNLHMKEMIVLISQAKDFRKPKFITAVIIGIPILHINYIFDCLLTSSLQSFDSYYLPITYSALHSYNLVPKNPLFTYVHQVTSTSHGKGNATKASSKQYLPYVFRPFPHPSRHLSNNSGKKMNEEYQGIFSNYRILNLTGMKIWDDILLLCHAQLLPRHDKALYKQLLSSPSNTSNKGQSVDLIMFDPISYTKSIIYHASQRRAGNLPSAEHIAKHLLLTDQETRILQQSHQKMQEMAASSPEGTMMISEGVKVVSIDWITHCIALNEVIHHHALDLFLLPSDPIHYPMALKLEPDVTGIPATAPNSNTVNTGERYSKYDLVYFHASIPSLSNSTGTSTSTLAVGKILSFSRRNESSVPLVKVQLLDTQTQVPTPSPVQNSSSSSGNKRKHVMVEENTFESAVKLLVPKKFTAEMIVSVAQLAGKVIVLHRKNYYKLYQALPANSNSTMENKKQLLQSAKDDKKSQKKEKDNEQTINAILKEDDVYSTSLDYERQYSVIPYQLKNDDDDEGSEEYGSDESEDGLGRKRKRFVLSQDI